MRLRPDANDRDRVGPVGIRRPAVNRPDFDRRGRSAQLNQSVVIRAGECRGIQIRHRAECPELISIAGNPGVL